MTTGGIILKIINLILYTAGYIGVLGFAPFIGFGIYFLIMHSKEKEEVKKKKLLVKGIIFIILPWVLIIGSLILLVILGATETMLNGNV